MNYGFPEYNGNQEFTVSEEKQITNAFKKDQLPLSCMVRTSVKYDSKLVANCVVALSKHFVMLLQQKKKGGELVPFCTIHIGDVHTIGYTEEVHKSGDIRERNVLIVSDKHNIITNAPEMVRLAQMLYVFIQLSYPKTDKQLKPGEKPRVTIISKDMSLFPDISQVPISPSQKFQFNYLAKCAKLGVPYNHEIVTYVHNLLLSQNTLVDLGQLPADFFAEKGGNAEIMTAVFETLGELGYISGICCTNVNNPTILKTLVTLLDMGTSLSIVHVENCNATEGLKQLFNSRARSTASFNIAYWDLAGNPLVDLNYLPFILSFNHAGLECLNLSNTNIKTEDLAAVFRELAKNERLQSLRHLYLRNATINPQTKEAFSEFINESADNRKLCLETLDLGRLSPVKNGDPLAWVLNEVHSRKVPLRKLSVAGNNITKAARLHLLQILRTSRTLEELDISDTSLSSEDALEVAKAVSDNGDIDAFRLRLNGIGMRGETFLEMFKLMMNGRSKWREFSLDHSSLTKEDVKTLATFLGRMPNTDGISLRGNFDAKMKDIGEDLPLLVRGRPGHPIKLKKIDIAGDSTHRLGPEIIPLLEELARSDSLEELDISDNGAGDAALPHVAAIIRTCPNLKAIRFDGNGFKDLDGLADVVAALKENKNMITAPFPILDGKAAAKAAKGEDGERVIDALARLQMESMKAINCNRSAKGFPNELPFEVTPELRELIDELSRDCRARIRGRKLMEHTLACEILGVPLPYQARGVLVEPETFEEVAGAEAMDIYETPCLARYTVEDKESYPGVLFTTMNPDIRTLIGLDEQKPPVQQSPRYGDSESNSSDGPKDSESAKEETPKKTKAAKKEKERGKRRRIESDSASSEDEYRRRRHHSSRHSSRHSSSHSSRRSSRHQSRYREEDEDNEEFELKTRFIPAMNSSSSDDENSSEERRRPLQRAPPVGRREISDPDDLPEPKPKSRPPSKRPPPSPSPSPSSSSSSEPPQPAPAPRKTPPRNPLSISTTTEVLERTLPPSSSSSSEPEPEPLPKPKPKPEPKPKPQPVPSDSSSESEPPPQPKPKPKPIPIPIQPSDSESDSDSSSDVSPRRKQLPPPGSTSSDDSDPVYPRRQQKPPPKPIYRRPQPSSSSSSVEEPMPRPRPARKPTHFKSESESESSGSISDSDSPPQIPKAKQVPLEPPETESSELDLVNLPRMRAHPLKPEPPSPVQKIPQKVQKPPKPQNLPKQQKLPKPQPKKFDGKSKIPALRRSRPYLIGSDSDSL